MPNITQNNSRPSVSPPQKEVSPRALKTLVVKSPKDLREKVKATLSKYDAVGEAAGELRGALAGSDTRLTTKANAQQLIGNFLEACRDYGGKAAELNLTFNAMSQHNRELFAPLMTEFREHNKYVAAPIGDSGPASAGRGLKPLVDSFLDVSDKHQAYHSSYNPFASSKDLDQAKPKLDRFMSEFDEHVSNCRTYLGILQKQTETIEKAPAVLVNTPSLREVENK